MGENNVMVSKPQVNVGLNMFADQQSFNTGYQMAKILSASTIVPKNFQGNIGNTMIAIDIAQRLHTNPLMIMQNMYVVYGNPSFSAKFLVACINASGLFATPLRYEFVGTQGKDDWGCYAFAIDKQGEVLKGSTVTIGMAKAEGWYNKDGSKWKVEPEQMLRYRAATRFQSVYCPEITCGLAIKEDLEDADYTEITSDNVQQLSEGKVSTAEEQLQAANEQEQAEANSQQLNMNNGESAAQNAEANNNKAEEQKAAESGENKAQTKPKAQPMGKQAPPSFFK